ALLVAVGLAVGVGLVVTVTAAAAGVGDAQTAVLHSLYGIGTDVTVTKAPPTSSSGSTSGMVSPGKNPQHLSKLGVVPGLDVLDASAVDAVARLKNVAAAAGSLTLTNTVFDVPSDKEAAQSGSIGSVTSFTVNGIDLAHLNLGPFSSGTIVSGRTFTSSDAASNVAIVDSSYAAAHKLSIGSTIDIAGTTFAVIGLIGQAESGGAADVYIPLCRAQALAQADGTNSLAGKITTIYVAAAGAGHVSSVKAEIAKLLPSATVTTSDSLADQVSGSLASAASLASD